MAIGKLFLDSSYESKLAQQSRQEEVRLGIRTIAQIEASDESILAAMEAAAKSMPVFIPDKTARKRLKLEWAKENFLPLEDYL